MTADRHLPNEELQRAILADGIARLEKQMEAAECRARDAEAEAREAKAALAEVLLDKAHGQKAKRASGEVRSAPAEREINALRAELEAAQRALRQQEARLRGAREDAAQDLRAEYEKKFHAARERLAQELQRRLSDGKSAPGKPPSGVAGGFVDGRPAAWEAIGRIAFLVPVAAFAGGLVLGWTAPSGESEPGVAALPAAATIVEAAPAVTAPSETAEPAALPLPLPPPPPAAAQPVAESPPADTAGRLPLEPPSEAGALTASSEPSGPAPAEDPHPLQERNASLVLQIEEIRRLLDEASARADAAEAALGAERRKSAALARRAAAAEQRQKEEAPPAPPANPQASVERTPRTPPAPAFFPRIE